MDKAPRLYKDSNNLFPFPVLSNERVFSGGSQSGSAKDVELGSVLG